MKLRKEGSMFSLSVCVNRQKLGTSEWSMLWRFRVYLISVQEMSKWIILLGIFVLDICVLIPEVWGDIKYRDNFSYPISSSKATCLLFNIIQTQRR